MLLDVKREPSSEGCTFGALYVDGVFECFTLEDVVREMRGVAVEEWKVPNQTAIPSGTYDVTVNRSARFRKLLPLLVNVPGFEGVRIHSGNVASDTEGCILLGRRREASSVVESRLAFNTLFAKVRAAIARGETVRIRITNPPLAQSRRQASVA